MRIFSSVSTLVGCAVALLSAAELGFSRVALASGFVENKGQLAPAARFYIRGSAVGLYLTDSGLVLDYDGSLGGNLGGGDLAKAHGAMSPDLARGELGAGGQAGVSSGAPAGGGLGGSQASPSFGLSGGEGGGSVAGDAFGGKVAAGSPGGTILTGLTPPTDLGATPVAEGALGGVLAGSPGSIGGVGGSGAVGGGMGAGAFGLTGAGLPGRAPADRASDRPEPAATERRRSSPNDVTQPGLQTMAPTPAAAHGRTGLETHLAQSSTRPTALESGVSGQRDSEWAAAGGRATILPDLPICPACKRTLTQLHRYCGYCGESLGRTLT